MLSVGYVQKLSFEGAFFEAAGVFTVSLVVVLHAKPTK